MFLLLLLLMSFLSIVDCNFFLSGRLILSLCLCLKSWFDHYLQWNQSEHPGVRNLRFTTEQVWTPDILLYNR